MNLTDAEIKKVAKLAHIKIDDSDIKSLQHDLSKILDMVAKMSAINTEGVEPLAHAFEATQPLREDVVSETNQRELFQSIAPKVKAGLYIVPAMIETE